MPKNDEEQFIIIALSKTIFHIGKRVTGSEEYVSLCTCKNLTHAMRIKLALQWKERHDKED